jgi:signal transduction histidine kinase
LSHAIAPGFRETLAERIRAEHQTLAARWLARLRQLLPLDAGEIFPGSDLLDHIPSLIVEIAAFVAMPQDQAIVANTAVHNKARELGSLRHAQRASVHQVLREYRILRGVIARFVAEEAARLATPPPTSELLDVLGQIDEAVSVLEQTTVDTFIAEYTATIGQQSLRLESYNRVVNHELRQPLAIFQYAVKLLAIDDGRIDDAKRAQLVATAERNVRRMTEILDTVSRFTRVHAAADDPSVQELSITTMAQDVARQLREMAEARSVEIRVAADMPVVLVDAARLELVFVNLLSNAIKYCDPAKSGRFVEVSGATDRDGRCRIVLRDNGVGIDDHDLESIFKPSFRAHADRDRELNTSGLGLGLSIVLDCLGAIAGDIRVESSLGDGTTFFVTVPSRPTAPRPQL